MNIVNLENRISQNIVKIRSYQNRINELLRKLDEAKSGKDYATRLRNELEEEYANRQMLMERLSEIDTGRYMIYIKASFTELFGKNISGLVDDKMQVIQSMFLSNIQKYEDEVSERRVSIDKLETDIGSLKNQINNLINGGI